MEAPKEGKGWSSSSPFMAHSHTVILSAFEGSRIHHPYEPDATRSKGIATKSKKLLVAPGLTTRSKDATRSYLNC